MSEQLTVEVPIEECLNGDTRETSTLDADSIEDFVAWTKDIERSRALRELATDRLDEATVTQAQSLLWVDAAEVYALCGSCYAENRDGAWTGSTSNADYDDLAAHMNQRLENGTTCAFCKADRVRALKEELKESIDVQVVVVEPEKEEEESAHD